MTEPDSSGDFAPGLIERSGPNAGAVHRLDHGSHVLGRGQGADVLIDDADVSRNHARLDVGVDGISVTDLGSKNGIYVNESAIAGTLTLGHGERFSIGELEFEVRHPASRVMQTLARQGESTATRTRLRPQQTGSSPSLLLPALGVLLFGILAVLLAVFG